MCSVIVRETGEYAGAWVTLAVPAFLPEVLPAVEIGWRLRREHWGYGYATEAAAELLPFGLGDAGLDRVVSIRHVDNARSERVMSKLGLRFEFQATVPSPPASPSRCTRSPAASSTCATAAAQHESLAPATTVHACGKRPNDLPCRRCKYSPNAWPSQPSPPSTEPYGTGRSAVAVCPDQGAQTSSAADSVNVRTDRQHG